MSDYAFNDADRQAIYRAIHTRRDVRSYRPDPVPRAVITRILAAAHSAPSVGFMQPWNFLLVHDVDVKRRVYEHFRTCQEEAAKLYDGDRRATYLALKLQGLLDAPMHIAVTCDPERGGPHVLGRATVRETDAYSTCLAVQNLWLAARAEGLGVGWMSILRADAVKAMLGVPPGVVLVAYLTLGWPVELPAEPMLQSVGWRRRLDLADLVFQDRWGVRAGVQVEGARTAAEPLGDGNVPSPEAQPPPAVATSPASAPPAEAAAVRNAQLTKPPGSLGRLEAVAVQVATVQKTAYPRWRRKSLVLCAGDHGVAEEGVSAYRRDVTAKMVLQFVAGGAAVNAFARQAGVTVTVADVGVDHDFGNATGLVHAKVRRGTRNFTREPAMTADACEAALAAGRRLVPDCDLLAVGEMGIGNSTSAAALACAFLGLEPEGVVGRGTGIGDRAWERKVDVVRHALALHGPDPVALGGYEIAALVGVLEEATRRGVPVVLDGFITGVAALWAVRRDPAVRAALLAGHRSAEAGHGAVLEALGLVPLLDLGLRLGEGSGAVLALGLVEAACRILSEMRTFDEAGITHPRDARGEQ